MCFLFLFNDESINTKNMCDNYVILAAGVGSRLRPITNSTPKCNVLIRGSSIIQHQIDSIKGHMNVHLAVGYMQEKVRPVTALPIHRYVNSRYDQTNNMYSLSKMKEKLYGKSFILRNGDVYIHNTYNLNECVTHMIEGQDNAILIDNSIYDEECMKVVLNEDNNIVQLSKQVSENKSDGVSLDFYFINADTSKLLFDMIDETLQLTEKEWTEVALQRLMDNGVLFKPVEINTLWKEIDTIQDLTDIHNCLTKIELETNPPDRFIVDLDGTVIRDEKAIPGAIESIQRMQKQTKVVFVTNNTSRNTQEYVHLLHSLGIHDVKENDIISPLRDVQIYLKNDYKRPYVFGNESVKQFLGHEEGQNDIIVLTNHTSYTYDQLCHLMYKINQSHVPIIASHKDKVCPHVLGHVPDIGIIIDMVKSCTGRTVDRIFGKPYLCRSLHEPYNTVVIGDNPYTDRSLAEHHGYRFVQVLTGRRTSIAELDQNCLPNLIASSIAVLF
jgi:HAD superfamily hydrolase (TIGR01450 family)